MNHTLDVLLIKPGSQKQLYGELSAFKLTAIEPPLWGALLAAFLRERGYAVALADAEVEGWSWDKTAARIAEQRPRLAVIVVSGTNPSASTMNMTGAGAILRRLRELAPAQKTMLWGLHPSALPERTLREETVDFVCQGEGFVTLPRLLDTLKSGRTDFAIEGLWYRQDGQARSNPPPAMWSDLDSLPMPAWDLLPMRQYRAHNWHCFDRIAERQPYAVIYTSLGCPFRCSFCCINTLFGKPRIRYRDPARVVAEIDWLVHNHGVRNIKIIDEMFVLNEDHVLRFCDLLIERGHDLNFWAYARVNTAKRSMLQRMKQAGINWVAYGFESASERVLRDATKGYQPAKVMDVVKMTRDEGLAICANFIFGLPEDDLQTMEQTLALAMEINGEWANLYSAMAFPGSQLYEQALANGWPLPETWQGYSQYAFECLPLPTRHLSATEVLRFRDAAFVRYYSNPAYLAAMRARYGAEVEQHLRDMLATSLRRRYA